MLIFELHPLMNANFSPRRNGDSSLKSPPTLNVSASNDSELRLLCVTQERNKLERPEKMVAAESGAHLCSVLPCARPSQHIIAGTMASTTAGLKLSRDDESH